MIKEGILELQEGRVNIWVNVIDFSRVFLIKFVELKLQHVCGSKGIQRKQQDKGHKGGTRLLALTEASEMGTAAGCDKPRMYNTWNNR